uniref:Uncharacterized protein n=1 Tax=Anguilla anguilla TaxID=7936 RepID=A0A0E9RVX2_ANGAN
MTNYSLQEKVLPLLKKIQGGYVGPNLEKEKIYMMKITFLYFIVFLHFSVAQK